MKTIYELQKTAEQLRKTTATASITPEDTFGLAADTLAYIALLEQNADSLGIRRTYNSYAAMMADSSAPVATDGRPLRYSQLVAIYNPDNHQQAENGNIYAWQRSTATEPWKLVGNLFTSEIRSRILDLGNIATVTGIWTAAAAGSVVNNPDIALIVATSGQQSAVIFQQYNADRTFQYALWDKKRYTRYIDHTGTAVTTIQPWQIDGVRNLEYYTATRILALKDMHGNTVGSTATLPIATTSASGLLSAADKQQLDNIASWKSGISQTVDELKDEVGLINTLTSNHEENIADLQNADTRRQRLVPAVAYVVQNTAVETTSSSSSSGIVYDAGRKCFLNVYAGKYYLAIPPGADPDRVFSNPPTGQLYAFGQNVLSGQAGYPAGLYRWDGSKPVQQSAATPATTSASGLLSAADKQLLAHAADLGTFSAAADMWEAAADIEYVADPAIALLFGTIGDQSAVIVQQYDKSRTMQYAYWDKKHYNRNIDHTDTEVTYVASWKQDCIDHIYYNPQTRIIHQRNRWNDTLTGGPLSTLPLASGSVAGLISPADKQALDQAVADIATLQADTRTLPFKGTIDDFDPATGLSDWPFGTDDLGNPTFTPTTTPHYFAVYFVRLTQQASGFQSNTFVLTDDGAKYYKTWPRIGNIAPSDSYRLSGSGNIPSTGRTYLKPDGTQYAVVKTTPAKGFEYDLVQIGM